MSWLIASSTATPVDVGTGAVLAALAAFVFRILSREQSGFERMAKSYKERAEAAEARAVAAEARVAHLEERHDEAVHTIRVLRAQLRKQGEP